MWIVGDVKCYYCGHISGELIGDDKDRITPRNFRPSPENEGYVPRAGQPLRCTRCGGPVYLEDIRPLLRKVKIRQPVLAAPSSEKEYARAS